MFLDVHMNKREKAVNGSVLYIIINVHVLT